MSFGVSCYPTRPPSNVNQYQEKQIHLRLKNIIIYIFFLLLCFRLFSSDYIAFRCRKHLDMVMFTRPLSLSIARCLCLWILCAAVFERRVYATMMVSI